MSALLHAITARLRGLLRLRLLGLVGTAIILSNLAIAILAAYIAPYDPFSLSSYILSPPSAAHILGTDQLGRDLFSRIIWGSRISLLFAAGGGGVSFVIGLFLGTLSGYFGGWIDEIFSRFVEMFLMIPQLFLLIIGVAFFGSNIFLTVAIVGLTVWPSNARIARAQVLALKERTFVLALRGLGLSSRRILFHHIVPNGIAPVLANSTLVMAYAILLEAGLSFLGLGDLRYVSWGQIIFDALSYVRSAWWMVVFPGVAISILVFGFYALGDSLRALWSPREEST
jgi:peptide/nickel transport system permease protein